MIVHFAYFVALCAGAAALTLIVDELLRWWRMWDAPERDNS
jgi:hypothetical protein